MRNLLSCQHPSQHFRALAKAQKPQKPKAKSLLPVAANCQLRMLFSFERSNPPRQTAPPGRAVHHAKAAIAVPRPLSTKYQISTTAEQNTLGKIPANSYVSRSALLRKNRTYVFDRFMSQRYVVDRLPSEEVQNQPLCEPLASGQEAALPRCRLERGRTSFANEAGSKEPENG